MQLHIAQAFGERPVLRRQQRIQRKALVLPLGCVPLLELSVGLAEPLQRRLGTVGVLAEAALQTPRVVRRKVNNGSHR